MSENIVKRFEDLEVWQLASELVEEIYALSKSTPMKNDYGLTRFPTKDVI